MEENGDPNANFDPVREPDKVEQQFLIKWLSWSHIHNTWESEQTLRDQKVSFVVCFLQLTMLSSNPIGISKFSFKFHIITNLTGIENHYKQILYQHFSAKMKFLVQYLELFPYLTNVIVCAL